MSNQGNLGFPDFVRSWSRNDGEKRREGEKRERDREKEGGRERLCVSVISG